MASKDQLEQFEKYTYFVCIVSSWARFMYLQRLPETTHEEYHELTLLRDWWNSIGEDDKENIRRIAKEHAQDVPAKHRKFIAATQNRHTDKIVQQGGVG